MNHNSLEKRIEALEERAVPADLESQIEDAFLEILTDEELHLLEHASKLKKSGASDDEVYAVLGDAKPDIDIKWELASDVVLQGSRLDEYNGIKQAIQDPLYKGV